MSLPSNSSCHTSVQAPALGWAARWTPFPTKTKAMTLVNRTRQQRPHMFLPSWESKESPADAFGAEPYASDAMVDAHEQRPPILAAKAKVGRPIFRSQATQQGAIGGHDTHSARPRGEN